MAEPVGMMSPPEDMEPMSPDMGGGSPLSPEETQEVQNLVDSSVSLARFIDAIAAVNPMDWGIDTSGATQEAPMEGEASPLPPMM